MSVTLQSITAKLRDSGPRLTAQHKQILRLIAQGLPNKVIQHETGLTITALNDTLRGLYRVTGTRHNRVRLAVWSAKRGLV